MRLPARLALFAAPLLILCTTLTYAKNYVPIMVGDIVVFIPQDTPPETKLDSTWFTTTPADFEFSHNVLANDSGIEGLAEFKIEIVPGPTIPGLRNAFSLTNGNAIYFQIQGGYVGQFSVFYRLKYKFRSTDTEYRYTSASEVIVDIKPPYIPPGNRAPLANTDRAVVPLNQQACNLQGSQSLNCQVSLDLLANDRDEDNDIIRFVKLKPLTYLSGPVEINGRQFDNGTYRGLINLQQNGRLIYTAAPNFFDPNHNLHYAGGPHYDTFQYSIVDTYGQESTGVVIITLGNTNPSPVVKQFEWDPAIVSVGQETTFRWNIENVQSCHAYTAGNGSPTQRAPSGTSGPYTYSRPEVHTTQWACTDLNGNPYPADGSRITTTRTVVNGGTTLTGELKWATSEIHVGQQARLLWNFTNASSCIASGPAINGSAPLSGTQLFTPYAVGDIISKWQCKNSQGAALAPREVTLKVKPLTKPILRKE
ncbi:Ig-like domain-containing protein [Bowmanella denitrificans]|uniref:Ig-like domain-containing protein n=1 Tax=Bowmanella denitrificans TaxID=366582 RepID=UPI000C9C618B|nr:Ig-like domain-containing protein [Bowmanella denitrificans]